MPRPSRKSKSTYEIEVDPRDPSRELWIWVHSGNHRRFTGSLTDEQVAQSVDGHMEHTRRQREAWLTDMEVLTGLEDTS